MHYSLKKEKKKKPPQSNRYIAYILDTLRFSSNEMVNKTTSTNPAPEPAPAPPLTVITLLFTRVLTNSELH